MEKRYLYSSLPKDWLERSTARANQRMPGAGDVFADNPEREDPLWLLSRTLIAECPFFDTLDEAKASIAHRAEQTGRVPPVMLRVRITLEVVDEEGKEIE